MKVTDIIGQGKRTLSFEVFPPKTEEKFEKTLATVMEIAGLHPDFMSVTYGAGGGVSDFTDRIASAIQEKGITTIAHLTCVSSDEARIDKMIELYKEKGIENIMALRGDIPDDFDYDNMTYKYASEIIPKIKAGGDFCIGGGCYPEKHPDCDTLEHDIDNLKKKVDAGCDFLTTQMFFDNDIFYDFMDRIIAKGINVPVLPGIMPITSAVQVEKVIRISSSSTPKKFDKMVETFGDDPDAMRRAGIMYAVDQIIDLYANGVDAVHLYAMNKPKTTAEIQAPLLDLLK